jgi:cytochrome c-type biogenesis protein CcmH/NrfF
MRSFLFSSAIISSVATGIGLLRSSLRGPLSWHLWLLWASWAISLVLAVATVMERKKR